MFVLLLPLCWAAALRWRLLVRRDDVAVWTGAFLEASVLIGVGIWVSTELLSRVDRLSRGPVIVFWLAALGCFVALCRRDAPESRPPRTPLRPPSPSSGALLLGLFLVTVAIGATAFFAAPNTYDGQSYHLPRVLHWIQNQNVEPYASHIERQVYFPPFAEYAMLHAFLLHGGDRFVNLVQSGAFFGSLVAAAGIATRLGASPTGSVVAAVIAGTIPMAVLQGSSPQNDLVLSFWILSFVWFGLGALERGDARSLLAAGSSLGLAGATKPLAAIWTASFLVWLTVGTIRRHGKGVVKPLLGSAAIALFFVLPFLLRNVGASGRFLGPADTGDAAASRHLNESWSLSTTVSNAVRNATLHLPFGPTGAARVEAVTRGALGALGIDPDDPRTTYPNARGYFRVQTLRRHDDLAGNPWHLLLVLTSLAGVLGPWGRGRGRRLLLYSLALACGPLLFSGLVKWQVWASRLHLPFFLLGAPLAAQWLESRSRRLAQGVGGLLLAAVVPWVVAGELRPLIGGDSIFERPRFEQLFAGSGPERQASEVRMNSYREAARWILEHRVERLGIVESSNAKEYPLWALLGGHAIRIRSVHVRNSTADLRPSGPSPSTPDDAVLFVLPTGSVEEPAPGLHEGVVHRTPFTILIAPRDTP